MKMELNHEEALVVAKALRMIEFKNQEFIVSKPEYLWFVEKLRRENFVAESVLKMLIDRNSAEVKS